MQNQAVPYKNPQSGNALWFILVAIALLAALTIALSHNSGKMADNLSSEQARIVAQQTIRDFNEYAAAVQRVMQTNNCSEVEVSFETSFVSPTSTYSNPKSPGDQRCHIFESLGAGLAARNKPTGAQDQSRAPTASTWKWAGNLSVNGVGPERESQGTCASKCAELIVGDQYIDPEVCRQFNLLVKFNGGTPPLAGAAPDWTVPWQGTYSEGTGAAERLFVGAGDSSSLLYGVTAACFYTMSGSYKNHQIYSVLLSR